MMNKAKILNNPPGTEDDRLVRHISLINLDQMFENSPGAKIINNETLVGKNLATEFVDSIYTKCDDALGFVPMCECGATFGLSKVDLVCPVCGTKCSSSFVNTLSHMNWLGIPVNMPPVIHPVWYMVLKSFTALGPRERGEADDSRNRNKISLRSKPSLIDFILNPEMEKEKYCTKDLPDKFYPLLKGRGFQYFYEHADEVLDLIIYEFPKIKKKSKGIEDMIEFRRMYQHLLFQRKLPVLHNSLHQISSNGDTLNYIDTASKDIMSAILNLSAMCFKEHSTNVARNKSGRYLYNVFMDAMDYYCSIIEDKLKGKRGLFREHLFGSRIHMCFRTVVHPHDSVMSMDEVILPWGIMVNGLKCIIMNFLVHRYHYTVSAALNKFTLSLIHYDPLVDQCIQEYINECPKKKIPICLGRNPTLNYGSIMLLYVRDYKRDPTDETLSINACIVKPANIGVL